METNLDLHYSKLYAESIKKIESNNQETDKLIDSSLDRRYGITLLFRPNKVIKSNIESFIDKLRFIEKDQYYYPSSDLHITVMSIIGCYNGFSLSQIEIEDYIKIIDESSGGLTNFEIEFRGLTASPSCIMIQGFPKSNILNDLRNNLRKNFRNSDLQHSIDSRYFIFSAHMTIVRFKESFRNPIDFVKLIKDYRNFYYGTTNVNKLELVFNDWYQRAKYVKMLHKFYL